MSINMHEPKFTIQSNPYVAALVDQQAPRALRWGDRNRFFTVARINMRRAPVSPLSEIFLGLRVPHQLNDPGAYAYLLTN